MKGAERSVKPDRRWLTKQYLVLLTVTALLALLGGATHLLIVVAADEVDTDLVAAIVWGVTGGLAVLMWAVATPAVVLWFRNLDYRIESDKIVPQGNPHQDPTEHSPGDGHRLPASADAV